MMRYSTIVSCLALGLGTHCANAADVQSGRLVLEKGDVITVVGNTFAERMVHHPHFEAAVQRAHPEHELVFRNLGWSADEVALQPRPLNFGMMEDHIRRTGADVLLGCFGINESFGGYQAVPKFREELNAWIDAHASMKIDGKAPVLVLVSPIAHETLGPPLPDGSERTHVLSRYRDVMRNEALKKGVLFVDLVRPTRRAMAVADEPLTINGIHLTDDGYRLVAAEMASQLGLPAVNRAAEPGTNDALMDAIKVRNDLFFQRWRPTNTEYVYGRRHRPYGNHNFPDEMEALDRMTAEGDATIHAILKQEAAP